MLSTLVSWVQVFLKAEQPSVPEESIQVQEAVQDTAVAQVTPATAPRTPPPVPPAPPAVVVPYENKYRAKFRATENRFWFSEEDMAWEKEQWENWKQTNAKEDDDAIDDNAFREIEQKMIERKLATCANNWMYENTPAGGLFMRYHADHEVFEYYSNHTIPYRYLDAAAMRYVVLFGCKPVFVDMDEELERTSKIGYRPTPKPEKLTSKELTWNNRTYTYSGYTAWRASSRSDYNSGMLSTFAKKKSVKTSPKNRGANPKHKSLKEHANQYVCIGKMCEFHPLQKAPVLDKNRKMTYAEYRKMMKAQQVNK